MNEGFNLHKSTFSLAALSLQKKIKYNITGKLLPAIVQ